MWNRCPKCCEDIKAFASVCPHCHSVIKEDDGELGFFGYVFCIIAWVILFIVFFG